MMKKDIESISEISWLLELLTIDALTKTKDFYLDIFEKCDIHISNNKSDFLE